MCIYSVVFDSVCNESNMYLVNEERDIAPW